MPAQVDVIPLFDRNAIETLHKVAGDEGPAFVAEIAQLFLVETRKSLDELQTACNEGDWAVVTRIAHSLKSSAATLGLMRLSDACQTLEMDPKSDASKEGTAVRVVSLLVDFEETVPILRSLC